MLTAAWNASTIPEFAEITAKDSTTHVTLTMDTAGKPFIQTSSAAGGTATLITATTTAATGPNHWDAAANWSTGAAPVNNDTVYFDNNDVPVLYGQPLPTDPGRKSKTRRPCPPRFRRS